MIDSWLKIYVTGDERGKWSRKFSKVLKFATVYSAIGVSELWGEEITDVVEHAYDDETRQWSVYDDLIPALNEYQKDQKQDVVAVALYANGKYQLHLFSTFNEQELFNFTEHLVFGVL